MPEKSFTWRSSVNSAKNFLESGKYAKALEWARVAIVTSNETDAESFLLAGEAAAGQERLDEAVYYYTRSLNLNPHCTYAREKRILSLLKLAESDELQLAKK